MDSSAKSGAGRSCGNRWAEFHAMDRDRSCADGRRLGRCSALLSASAGRTRRRDARLPAKIVDRRWRRLARIDHRGVAVRRGLPVRHRSLRRDSCHQCESTRRESERHRSSSRASRLRSRHNRLHVGNFGRAERCLPQHRQRHLHARAYNGSPQSAHARLARARQYFSLPPAELRGFLDCNAHVHVA